MYLYVEFANTYSAYEEAQMGFSISSSNKRIKKIKLTDEQIRELEPRETYRSGEFALYEKVSILSIQED